MSKSLNFNNVTKHYLNITFADEKATTISVCMPTKGLLRELTALTGNLSVENGLDAMDELYEVCIKIMNRNKTGVVITKEFLEDLFDFEDIIVFVNAYMSFIREVAGRKN